MTRYALCMPHFHTILGLMDAQDPLLSCEHHGSDHLPWLLHERALNPSILSRCFGEVGRWMDGLRFVNGKLLPLGLPSSSVHPVDRMRPSGTFRPSGLICTERQIVSPLSAMCHTSITLIQRPNPGPIISKPSLEIEDAVRSSSRGLLSGMVIHKCSLMRDM